MQVSLNEFVAFKRFVAVEVSGENFVGFEVVGHAELFAVVAADAESIYGRGLDAGLQGGSLCRTAFF